MSKQRRKRSTMTPKKQRRRPKHNDVETTHDAPIETPREKPSKFHEQMRDIYSRPLPNEER